MLHINGLLFVFHLNHKNPNSDLLYNVVGNINNSCDDKL